MQKRIEELVTHFNMQPHPEGGFYTQTYRSDEGIKQPALPVRFSGDRFFSTAIYFLLPAGVFSAFHRIKSDECWHFYEGGPLHIYVIDAAGKLQTTRLGNDIANGETFQFVVLAGCWFASKPANNDGYSFVGCTVSPGFDFADFELAEREDLMGLYPEHAELIRELTR